MLIIGAKGHALEVLQCLSLTERNNVVFFDDINFDAPNKVLGLYPLFHTEDEARSYLVQNDPRFVIGIGVPALRKKLADRFVAWGGKLTSAIASTAIVSSESELDIGLNVMHHTLIAPSAKLGIGVLLNANASIHHDCKIGDYCEISPGARILGRCILGQACQIGAGAVILPGMVLGDGVTVGAGAVVRQSVPTATTVVGVPARPLPHK